MRVPRDTAAVAEALLGTIAADDLFAAQRPDREHRVQRGDTLSKIAKEFYGDASLYTKIFEANQDRLKNPDLIQVGQKLRIP